MGTIQYSKIAPTFPPPKRTPRIRMASPIALHSSATVGKKRNITDIGMVICCGRWAAGLAGCGVGRCWRLAAGCCEGWQGVQAVQLVGCGVIGAALALLLVSVCCWQVVQVGGVICCGGGVPAG